MSETKIARKTAVSLEKLVSMSSAEIRAVAIDRGYKILSNGKKSVIEEFLAAQRSDALLEAEAPFAEVTDEAEAEDEVEE